MRISDKELEAFVAGKDISFPILDVVHELLEFRARAKRDTDPVDSPREYDPADRVAPPPSDAGKPISGIEIQFAIPVYVGRGFESILQAVIEAITKAPENTPKEGVHWVNFVGGKLSFSGADSRMLGRPADANGPVDGAEPTCDSTILSIGTHSRGWDNERERERVLSRRIKT
jgi:hypothetical protein